MKKRLHLLAIILLFILGISALVPGWNLVMDVSGKGLGLPLEVLEGSPFHDFFYPGLILFLVVGFFSLVIMFLTILKVRNYFWLIIVQGLLLLGWLVAESIFRIYSIEFQLPYAVIGITLVVIGVLLKNKSKKKVYENRSSG